MNVPFTAIVLCGPQFTDVMRCADNDSSNVGLKRGSLPGKPSSQKSLLPQTYTWPLALTATECEAPAAMSIMSQMLWMPRNELHASFDVSMPSWPICPLPVASTSPAAVTQPSGVSVQSLSRKRARESAQAYRSTRAYARCRTQP